MGSAYDFNQQIECTTQGEVKIFPLHTCKRAAPLNSFLSWIRQRNVNNIQLLCLYYVMFVISLF